MWTAILIDDESIALDVLDIQLAGIGGVTVVGRFQRVSEALEQAARLQPDLIFLDIEMPGTSGLVVAESLLALCPDAEIIYVTAHHQYAIDAFDTNAIGYLLKPVAEDRLARALSRYADMRAREAKRHAAISGNAGKAEQARPLSLVMMGGLKLYDAEGQLMTWRTKKTKELFAYLWHHGGTPVYRYHILDALWPDLVAERAQALLHTSLYNLRSALKAAGHSDSVAFGDERYWLRTDSISSDVERLEELIRKGGRVSDAEELLDLYRGDYLEVEHYDWAQLRQYELRVAFLACLEQALGQASGPMRERLQQKLIELDSARE